LIQISELDIDFIELIKSFSYRIRLIKLLISPNCRCLPNSLVSKSVTYFIGKLFNTSSNSLSIIFSC
jgi:hypothetical protein